MSNQVRLSSKLAADEECNGLDSLADSLRANPHQVTCALTWITVRNIIEDVETGDRLPTVQIRRIEPIAVVDKVPAEVIKLALDLYQKRTGKTPLPFDVIETVEGGYVMPPEDEDA